MARPDLAHRSIQWIALALFGVAFLGPWSYDLINVPAEYACDTPFVRLVGDFCGQSYSGISVVFGILQEALFGAHDALPGQNAVPEGIGRVLMASAALLILAPVLMLALDSGSRKAPSRSWQQTIILVGGLLPLAILLPYATTLPPQALWGFWLYLAVAAGLIVAEAYRAWTHRPRRAMA